MVPTQLKALLPRASEDAMWAAWDESNKNQTVTW